MQATDLSAFTQYCRFRGRSSLSTWLTRIVVNELLGRRRADQRRRRHLEQEGIAVLDTYRDTLMRGSDGTSARHRRWRVSKSANFWNMPSPPFPIRSAPSSC